MVTKVCINDNTNTPIRYLSDLDNFQNGKTFEFKAGVNIIVGENGSGKSTLLNLIKRYLLVDHRGCGRGIFNNRINALCKDIVDRTPKLYDGVGVYADYDKNTFSLCHEGEIESDEIMKSRLNFAAYIEQARASTGEAVVVAINALWKIIFSPDAKLKFDYSALKSDYPEYVEYVDKHRIECADEYTILMDEPDRNLSLENIGHIRNVLSFHKEQTQIIAVIHNPLLIYYLVKKNTVNVVEMTEGYVDKVMRTVKEMTRKL